MIIIFKAKGPDWADADLHCEDHGADASHHDFSEDMMPCPEWARAARDRLQEVISGIRFDRSGVTLGFESILEIISTFWSGFIYANLGQDVFLYEGAQMGFLRQELLPAFHGVEIIYVQGSFGVFQGSDALDQYAARKAAYVAKADSLLVGVPTHRDFERCNTLSKSKRQARSRIAIALFQSGFAANEADELVPPPREGDDEFLDSQDPRIADSLARQAAYMATFPRR